MNPSRSALAAFVLLPALSAAHSARAAEPGPTLINADQPMTKRLPGGALLHLSRGTRLEVLRMRKLPLGPTGSDETPTQALMLVSGRVDVELPISKVPKTAVLFLAPHKTSAVAKGGHSIAIAAADRVTFAAIDNEMLAASGNAWKALPSGMVRSFVGADPTAREHRVPGAPTLTTSQALVLPPQFGGLPLNVDIGSVAQAQKYELILWRVGEKNRELLSRREARAGVNPLPLSGLSPGQYELSARASDAGGIFGQDSPARSLRVIGVELPAGARSENGRILLGVRSRVKLLNVDGLEASYGRSSQFVNAPHSVGLSHGDAATLHLRAPGSAQEISLRLEPRALRADVDITPKEAQWPRDHIAVTVRLFDAQGRPVAETVPVKLTVMVNIEPITVDWTRTGNLLSTHVPAPRGPGPWVVRVGVNDEFGDEAGRDFLEVAGTDSERVSSR